MENLTATMKKSHLILMVLKTAFLTGHGYFLNSNSRSKLDKKGNMPHDCKNINNQHRFKLTDFASTENLPSEIQANAYLLNWVQRKHHQTVSKKLPRTKAKHLFKSNKNKT